MITNRDQKIRDFIDDFKYATTKQIYQMFFTNYRYCQLRLEKLYKRKLFKRTKSTINNEFAYYIDKKSYIAQVHHDLLRTEFYVRTVKKYEVLKWDNEFTIDNIRPDAVAYIKNNNHIFPVLIEIHLSNKFDFDKYIAFCRNNSLTVLFGDIAPRVAIITDKAVEIPPKIGIRFKIIQVEEMDQGINEFFR